MLQDKGKPFSVFKFTYAIGKGLALPAIQRRYANSNGLQIAVVNKMHGVLGIKEAVISNLMIWTSEDMDI